MNTKSYTGIIALVIIVILVIGFAVWYMKMPTQTIQTPSTATTTVLYVCNQSKTITAQYHEGQSKPSATPGQPPIPGGSVNVGLSDGRNMTLAQTISADGTRYANADESFVFWSKGNGALVLENNQQQTYVGCIALAPEPADQSLPAVYANSGAGFSILLPSLVASTSKDTTQYKLDEGYRYQALGPGKDIFGIKFTIPVSLTMGTNLSNDSYMSVEEIPQTSSCSAGLFLGQSGKAGNATAQTINDSGMTYSFASSTGAAAGNRYEEWVYAFPGTNPCIAMRYFIHYGAIGNYPTGTVKEFDKNALLTQFDAIRHTLVIVQ